ncbi:Spy/CpxP family protein refolding chaperone [Pseudomonas nitritireducens]|uniref:Spy/CpxP family protein refolding chaperone n=1 Tax=Pseudomonas nitroreducens TaxID=46680 RepID=A0A7W7P518_PSENT|nr:hypothetical protein [Pseudomonas nitritireducens]MBB4866827.1 Spy/CpxP family protein refolding chaperone [Pseudomonas nitritireducens]
MQKMLKIARPYTLAVALCGLLVGAGQAMADEAIKPVGASGEAAQHEGCVPGKGRGGKHRPQISSEEKAKIDAMSQDERKAYFKQKREEWKQNHPEGRPRGGEGSGDFPPPPPPGEA